jgi:hypothetical protein
MGSGMEKATDNREMSGSEIRSPVTEHNAQ